MMNFIRQGFVAWGVFLIYTAFLLGYWAWVGNVEAKEHQPTNRGG